jgi:hypothetical protein
MLIETTEEYMKRKGLNKGDLVGGDPTDTDPPVFETTEAYMKRKGLSEGDPIATDPEEAGRIILEDQVDYLARKAAEAAAGPPAKKAKGDKATEGED